MISVRELMQFLTGRRNKVRVDICESYDGTRLEIRFREGLLSKNPYYMMSVPKSYLLIEKYQFTGGIGNEGKSKLRSEKD